MKNRAFGKALYHIVLAFLLTLISFVCSYAIILHSKGTDEIYEFLFLLPLCYGITSCVSIFLSTNKVFSSIVSIIIIGGYFIKMVITPLCFALGGHKSFIDGYVTEQAINEAIWLMCLETIVVFLVMACCVRKMPIQIV